METKLKVPGISKQQFHIFFPNENPFSKNDVITFGTGAIMKVKAVKIYKFTWWRKILFYFGFKIKSSNCVKVEVQ